MPFFNPGTQEAETAELCEFKDSLVYVVSGSLGLHSEILSKK